jgi:hypothetical protein
LRRDTGHRKEACSRESAYIAFGKPAVPKVKRAKEARSVIRSPGFRQKMMTATAAYTVANAMWNATA